MIAVLLIIGVVSLLTWAYYKLLLKNAEIEMLKEHVYYDKSDLQNAWNGGYVEGVHSEAGHQTKTFHEWYQMHKFAKKYGK
jgi:hypothetical protein